MSTAKSDSNRTRRKLLYVAILVLALLLGLVLTMDGFHPFPIIPPTPAYP